MFGKGKADNTALIIAMNRPSGGSKKPSSMDDSGDDMSSGDYTSRGRPENDTENHYDAGLETAMEELASAAADKDWKAMAVAFKSAMSMCNNEESEDGSQEGDE